MKLKTVLLLIIVSFVLIGCMPGTGNNNFDHPAGFFTGVWHGWIAPLSLIFGFFNSNITIYETYNSGWWYDFGFYIAVISGFGGISLFRKNKKED